jgi:hypothetical protein
VGREMTATRYEAPTPEGATEVSEWADVGTPGEFRCFSGAIRTIPEIRYSDDVPASVSVDGTQLADGRVEERYIRVTGVSWEDMLTSGTARKLCVAIAAAADDLDRLEGLR